ncbi:hypothetical protein SBRY_10377 [Actinacidiphila bryophytorum]|uniref:Uncharacterized protein n=1 Tax=Actinacidiphila bryophytorum TaxID=1436133 RepID=A0A9W4E0B4_9ACTN|nr:hypothetical protein SBRY_10377 [Actinacidiphila bryophytorum]
MGGVPVGTGRPPRPRPRHEHPERPPAGEGGDAGRRQIPQRPGPRGVAPHRAGAYPLGLQRGRRLDRTPTRAPGGLRGRVCATGSGQPLGSP